jgi:ArsR family transcriptional regulator
MNGVEILKEIEMPQSALSYHLKILCENEILSAEIVWHWTYYTINNAGIEKAIALLKQFEVEK